MKKNLVVASLLLNLLLVGGAWLVVQRLGGWRFFRQRWQHQEAPLYQHRRQLFEQLPAQTGAIIFLGDSQTALCEWRELFGDTLPILNRGIVADQVAGVRLRLEEILRHRPAKIFLLIGINDLLFGKNAEQIAGTYQQIIDRIRREVPATQLVLESVLPVNNAVKNTGIKNVDVQALNDRIAELAQTQQLPFVDIYSALADPTGNLDARFTADGLHLNAAGYLVWKRQLEPFLLP